MANKNPQKIPKKFFCEICDYHTSNKKDFTKHLLTAKHSRLTNANQKSPKNPQTIIYFFAIVKTHISTYLLYQNIKNNVKTDIFKNKRFQKNQFFSPKLFWEFQKWTKKMSKFHFPKKVSEKTCRETIF